MEIRDVRGLMADVFAAGYMEAVKAYEPTADVMRKEEVKRWLAHMGQQPEVLKRLEKAGLVKPVKKGAGINSPFLYSKAEIKKALAMRTAALLHAEDLLR